LGCWKMFDVLGGRYACALVFGGLVWMMNLQRACVVGALCVSSIRLAAFAADRYRTRNARGERMDFGKTYAHRGGRMSTPENTMPAFENASQMVDVLELDVWLTKDNKVVVFHDSTFDRVCGRQGVIAETKFADLPKVLKRPSDGFPQGEKNARVADENHIPLFMEVLDLLSQPERKDRKVLVEFKQHNKVLVELVKSMLYSRGFVQDDRVVWFSLEYGINRLLGASDPSIPRLSSVPEVITYTLLFWLGLLPLMPMDISMFGITCGTLESLHSFVETVSVLCSMPYEIQMFIVRTYRAMLTSPDMFTYMKSRNIMCVLLGVNTDEDLEFSREMGADMVITDNPEWLAKAI